jgi:hypothetical protein
MTISLDDFKRAFTHANVGMHGVLQRGLDEQSFDEGWRMYVMPLERLTVSPQDRGYRDLYVEWFYDLAGVAGFPDVAGRYSGLGDCDPTTLHVNPGSTY